MRVRQLVPRSLARGTAAQARGTAAQARGTAKGVARLGGSLALVAGSLAAGAGVATVAGVVAATPAVAATTSPTWVQTSQLPNDIGPGGFGQAVAFSPDGKYAVVGETGSGGAAGSVQLYTWSGTAWGAPTLLPQPAGSPDGNFGAAVAVADTASGPAVLVGDPTMDSDQGVVFEYTWNEVGTEIDYLYGPSGSTDFGTSVAISADGSEALVGAPSATSNVAGTATEVQLTGADAETALVPTPTVPIDQAYGTSVAFSSDDTMAVVGDPTQLNPVGVVDVFVSSADQWTYEYNFGFGPSFGTSVAIAGDPTTNNAVIVVGEPLENQVSAYKLTDHAYIDEPVIDTPTGAQDFGQSVAISPDGGTVVVGDPGADAATVYPVAAGGAGTSLALPAGAAAFGSAVALTESAFQGGSGNVLQAMVGDPDAGTTTVYDATTATQLSATAVSAVASASPTVTSSASSTTITLDDSSGDPVDAVVPITVDLGSDSTGQAEFADSSGTPETTATIPVGQSSVTAYYGDTLAGSHALTFSAAGLASATATATVTAAPATQLVLSLAGQPTAGVPINVSVAADDEFGNLDSTFDEMVALTSTPTNAEFPNGPSLAVSDGQGSGTVIFHTAGPSELVASGETTVITGESAANVVPGVATHFFISPTAPDGFSTEAGVPDTFTVAPEDVDDNVATSYTGTVTFSSSDPNAVLPPSTSFTPASDASTTVAVTLGTVASAGQTVSVTDGSITGTSPSITVTSADAATFTVSPAAGDPAVATAGTPYPLTVTALDADQNVASGYTGTVHFTSSDGGTGLPADTTFTAGDDGVITVPVTFDTVGAPTVTAADTSAPAITGTSAAITVDPASASQLAITIAGPATAGTAATATVTAEDPFGNPVTTDDDTVQVTSSDSAAIFPPGASVTLADGTATFPVTFQTAKDQTVSGTTGGANPITGTSLPVQVNPGAPTQLVVTVPANTTAGQAVQAAVTIEDEAGNTVTSDNDTVTFTSSDPLAALPQATPLAGGTATVPVTFDTSGLQTLSVIDGVLTASASATVAPGPAAQLMVTAPATINTDQSLTVGVTAEDAFGNLAVAYAGQLSVTTSDPAATVPADGGLTGGTGSFPLTLGTEGDQSVTVTDTATPTLTGSTTVRVIAVPSAPTGLVATAGTAGITLTWQAPADNGGSPITSYQVFSGIAAGGEGATAVATVTGTTYVDRSAPLGVQQYYVVRATNEVGASQPSTEATALRSRDLSSGSYVASLSDGQGYWVAGANGSVTPYGAAANLGSMAGQSLNQPIVGIAATPDGRGYWLVAADGGMFAFGDAHFYGSLALNHLNQPIVGIAATPDGRGYWLVAADGGIFAFGDAGFYGSTGSIHLNQPIVGIAATPDGGGYWMVASDGGIFSFGDAGFYGSTGSIHLNQPIVGMASTPDGGGYWMVASDGGVFSFGDAGFFGSVGGSSGFNALGLVADPDGAGYGIVAQGGTETSFGS